MCTVYESKIVLNAKPAAKPSQYARFSSLAVPSGPLLLIYPVPFRRDLDDMNACARYRVRFGVPVTREDCDHRIPDVDNDGHSEHDHSAYRVIHQRSSYRMSHVDHYPV